MEYDLIVIGAGPGGYEAAFEAADLGMKTALIEKEEPGGTCLNHGCIPTKALLHGAGLFRKMKDAEALGISTGEVLYDLRKMQERKQDVVLRLRKGIEAIRFPLCGKETASFGVAEARPQETEDEVVMRADMALYKAKRLGKNQVQTD